MARARATQAPGVLEAAVELEQKVWELRLSGMSLHTIAAHLKISSSTAHKHWHRRLNAARKAGEGKAIDHVTLENERYDDWLNALTPFLMAGSPAHMAVAVAISKERRKLNGWDAPSRIQHEGKDGGPIVVQQKRDLSALTSEDLDDLERIHTRLAGRAEPGGNSGGEGAS